MAVNNEIGPSSPLWHRRSSGKIAQRLVSCRCGLQPWAKVATEVSFTPGARGLYDLSSHKFHGPWSWLCLHQRRAKITPSLTGGGQEKEMRSTTENVRGIAATAKALRLATENQALLPARPSRWKKWSKNWPTIQMSLFFLVRLFCTSYLDFRDQGSSWRSSGPCLEEFWYLHLNNQCLLVQSW